MSACVLMSYSFPIFRRNTGRDTYPPESTPKEPPYTATRPYGSAEDTSPTPNCRNNVCLAISEAEDDHSYTYTPGYAPPGSPWVPTYTMANALTDMRLLVLEVIFVTGVYVISELNLSPVKLYVQVPSLQ